MEELDFWLASTLEKRGELLDYSRRPLPTEPGERQMDVSRALELGQDAGDLLADAEEALSIAIARETLAVKSEAAGLSADERKVVVKGRVAKLARLRDGLQVLYTSIKDRRFVLMNLNRSA